MEHSRRDFVTVVIAVFRPDPAQLEVQVASLAAQTLRPSLLIAVIADLASDALIEEVAARHGLPCKIVMPDQGMDAPRAFAAGLAAAVEHAPPEALIAFSDQDDLWHPERLARGAHALEDPGVSMVHSDARVVDAAGTVMHPSLFALERRQRAPGLRDLLLRNTVTGMTMLFRRELAELSLPFPAQAGVHFYHDLWLALLATARGRVVLLKEPLVDYRQHGGNAVGAVQRPRAGWRPNLGRKALWSWGRRKATSYALARYLAQSVQARMSEFVLAGHLAPEAAKTSALRPYLRRRGLGLPLVADALRLALTGRLDLARISLCHAGVTFGRLGLCLRETLGAGLTSTLERLDTRLYGLSPGVAPPALDSSGNVICKGPPLEPAAAAPPEPRQKVQSAASFIDTRKLPSWRPRFDAPEPAIALLVPTLNPTEAFAGIATAIDLGIGLAARGHRVRMIATDLPIANAAASRAFVEGRIGNAAAEAAGRISLHCGLTGDSTGPSGPEISQHRADTFLATAWWTAHVARTLMRDHEMEQWRFVYLIQDFEPNFYAWGTTFAEAAESYGMDYLPVFNTTLLRDHFAHLGHCPPDALAFRPSIDISRYSRGARAPRSGPRRLALYGRPEVERNMYPMAIEALERFVAAERLGPEEIELVSVGLKHDPVEFSTGARLTSLGKLPWEDYPGYLLTVDLGLSLMLSPHPSHPPIEMAASGVRVVTNSYGSKDLSRLSPSILSPEASAEAVCAALLQAWAAGPVPDSQRTIDLSPLGQPMDEMMDHLSGLLAQDGAQSETAA
ncbi:rhamnosyltransferase WsaF family glycosyltransferase [Vannielia litorea]|uniref:rhamnosyltransferase WsaF family glycosyltransferase n=1 Tax=Vannielia litorea TaxID=1217970 RepID=UPI003140C2F9